MVSNVSPVYYVGKHSWCIEVFEHVQDWLGHLVSSCIPKEGFPVSSPPPPLRGPGGGGGVGPLIPQL